MEQKQLNTLKQIHDGKQLPEGMLVNSVINTKAGLKGKGNVLCNAAPAGYEAQISTLTDIKREVIEQVFYTVGENQGGLTAFVPIKTGEGAFSNESLYYTNFTLDGNFTSGIMGQGKGTRKGKTDIGYDTKRLPNFFWSGEMDYSIIELEQANRNGGSSVINLIRDREIARKTEWDIGIQETALLGQSNLDGIDGLLTLSGITTDTTTLVKPLSAMNPTEINAFAKNIVKVFFANTGSTRLPNAFSIPTADFLGLPTFVAENQPLTSKAMFLEQAFKSATQNPNFKVTHTAYNNLENNNLGVNRYVLYRNDSQTLEMNLPIDYTTTTFGTVNNFDFSNVAYGQFSGVIAKRPQEVYYLDHSVVI
jgi:hypothetical protein